MKYFFIISLEYHIFNMNCIFTPLRLARKKYAKKSRSSGQKSIFIYGGLLDSIFHPHPLTFG